jgi:hypothetical protein
MPAVNDVGEPCAGEPHARFDGRELETEHADHGHRGGTADRETGGTKAPGPTVRRSHRASPRPYIMGVFEGGVDQLKSAPGLGE